MQNIEVSQDSAAAQDIHMSDDDLLHFFQQLTSPDMKRAIKEILDHIDLNQKDSHDEVVIAAGLKVKVTPAV